MTQHKPDTIAQALHKAADELRRSSPTPRLDAELLLAHTLGWRRSQVLAEGHQPLTPKQQSAFQALVGQRAALAPVAYLTGHKEFYGLDVVVTPAVLVPRPETELLVDLALVAARQRSAEGAGLVIADIGTGSGCIAVALAVHLPQAHIYAIDISRPALDVAHQNSMRQGVAKRVQLLEGDLLAPLQGPVALIVSNPPYTVLSDIDENVRRHEPQLALDGGPDGLAIYRRLIQAAPARLRPAGALLLEIGATQGRPVAALAHEHFPNAHIMIHQDLAGLDRVVVVDNAVIPV